MAAAQVPLVSYAICADDTKPASDGTLCTYGSKTFSPACYRGDTPAGTTFKCPQSSGSKDDTQGQFCPSRKPKGEHRCCIEMSYQACPAGHCVKYEETCCGNGACDGDVECCGGVCLKTGETCCGSTSSIQSVCASDKRCVSGSCVASSSSTSTSRRSTTTSRRSTTALSTTRSRTSTSTSETTLSDAISVGPSESSAPDFNANQNSGDLSAKTTASTGPGAAILATAIPISVMNDPEAACFLNTRHTSFYTTPAWYKTLPASVQSAFSASRTGLSSSICTSTTALTTDDDGAGVSGGRGGLRLGAKVGIGAAVPLVALLFGLLLLLKFKPGVFGSKKQQAENETGTETEKTTGGGALAHSAASELTASPAISKSTPMTMNSSLVGGSNADPKSYPVGTEVVGHYPSASEPQNEFSHQPHHSELYANAAVATGPANNITISRRPVATQHDVEAGRSELAASPDTTNFSPRIGAHELAGLERYEMDGSDQRHEAPGVTR